MANRIAPLIIGIAGGTGSGKTTIASRIIERIGTTHIALVMHDSYYKDLSALSLEERSLVNFDHPDALETDLLIQHLEQLKSGISADIPVYDFKTHTRSIQTERIDPKPIIMLEGILIFVETALRALCDIKIFVDTDSDIRFIRRLERDIAERGRTSDSVIKQYLNTVRPMHLEFVEPSKRYADVIVPEGGLNQVAMEMIVTRLEALIQKSLANQTQFSNERLNYDQST
jgi:uridine kinase